MLSTRWIPQSSSGLATSSTPQCYMLRHSRTHYPCSTSQHQATAPRSIRAQQAQNSSYYAKNEKPYSVRETSSCSSSILLRSMHQTTQQQLTQAQQMLHEMQHRYDRLLEAP